MPLRPFSAVPYMPLLSLRPAEMRALQELPNKTKDRMLPVIGLRPWLGANLLEKGLARLAEAYGERPTIVAVDAAELTDQPRPVHAELAAHVVEPQFAEVTSGDSHCEISPSADRRAAGPAT